nr:CYP4C33-like protein 3 [Diaphanosoma celebensis]
MALELVDDWFQLERGTCSIGGLVIVLLTAIALALRKRFEFIRRVDKVPGQPGGWTIWGNLPTRALTPDEIFRITVGYVDLYRKEGPIIRTWAGPFPMYFLFTAPAFEAVLSSSSLIDKSREYNFLHPWLNTGLLTSTGSKWQERRKILTPAFHFKILEDFVHIFNEQSRVLVGKLREEAAKGEDLDVYPFVTRCTLDIICESAMGKKINAQNESESEYVKAVYSMSRLVQKRTVTLWLFADWMFNLSPYGREQRRCLKILHAFTDEVIRERRTASRRRSEQKSDENEAHSLGRKRRMGFLDLLIDASQDGHLLSDADIREEVDTFMFEGHDTTAAAISWSLFLIASYPHVQASVNEELERVFGDSDRSISMADISELKYLECCIKEALRLYPSVPFLGRQLAHDTTIHGYDIPAGSTALLLTYVLHRDPQYFPDPESYQPERFFAENVRARKHPYAYVPFSAGPRNCIGQKFALMEEKVVLASVFRKFDVTAVGKRDHLHLLGELILRPRDGIRLHLTPKKAQPPRSAAQTAEHRGGV